MSGGIPSVAIVGGGFSGAAVAFHLARGGWPGRITVFEPRPVMGAGLAYSTNDPAHRINVPATRMSLLPDEQPDHFKGWLHGRPELADDPAATLADGRVFPTRALFGRYVAEQLAPFVRAGAIVHHRDTVVDARPDGDRWRLATLSGERDLADTLVLATSHPPPALPHALAGLTGHPGMIADPWQPDALGAIAPDASVLIVGTGLTMADVVATLNRRGHRGAILAISRRGQRSHGHAAPGIEPEGEFAKPPTGSAVALLRRVRSAVAEAARHGRSWHGVLDRVRTQGPVIWEALSPDQKASLVRHLRPYWDTHRFRIAPQTEEIIEQAQADGRLRIAAARMTGAGERAGRLHVDLLTRHGLIEQRTFDAIVNTTGPGHRDVVASSALLASLARQGIIRAGVLGLGLLVDADNRASGTADGCLRPFVTGPLARERVGELMGLPEVARHAIRVADDVKTLSRGRAAAPREGAGWIKPSIE